MPHKISDQLTVEYIVFCEDIREEIGHKFTACGVINGDIRVASFPATLRMAFFGSVICTAPSAITEMQLKLDDLSIGQARIHFEFTEDNPVASLVVPSGFLQIDSPRDFTLSLAHGGEPVVLIRKKIILGEISPSSIALQPHA